jgi:CubicO group peptidase (beta-lactamase class C family)
MRRVLAVFTLIIVLFLNNIVFASGYYPSTSWETITPEEAGYDTGKLAIARQYAGTLDSIGGMVLYDGKVLMEWGNVTKKGDMHSVRKSFISALYGTYVTEGKINLNATLSQLGIDDKGGLTEQEKQAKVIDLLKARSGVYHEASYETNTMKTERPLRGSYAPGTHWFYNNWDFNVLATILDKSTGQTIGKVFYDRIATQTGMQDFTKNDVRYFYESVSVHPAYLFKMSARDMARFGLLYLRGGEWEGEQVIPKGWIEDSIKGYSSAGSGVEYGYLWWVAKGWLLGNKINGTAYRADGVGGQFIIVMPEEKLVIVHVSNYDNSKIDSHKPFGQFVRYLLTAKNR